MDGLRTVGRYVHLNTELRMRRESRRTTFTHCLMRSCSLDSAASRMLAAFF